MCNELEEILHGVELIRECSPRTMDLVMSFGERLSCRLATAYMRARGMEAVLVDARELIVTNDRFGSASVDFDRSYQRIEARLSAIRGISVVPGFIGATEKGVTTTIGRNGSDYTASIIGAGARAGMIEIWTDVDGVLSADPRIVPDAFVIPGSATRKPWSCPTSAQRSSIPTPWFPPWKRTSLCSSRTASTPPPRDADRRSRRLRGSRRGREAVTGIASIAGISLVNIEGGGMMGIPGFAARIFSALAREGVNIIMISQASSEHTICLVFRTGEGERALAALNQELALELETRRIERFELMRDLLVVSVIGENMDGTPGWPGGCSAPWARRGSTSCVIAQGPRSATSPSSSRRRTTPSPCAPSTRRFSPR